MTITRPIKANIQNRCLKIPNFRPIFQPLKTDFQKSLYFFLKLWSIGSSTYLKRFFLFIIRFWQNLSFKNRLRSSVRKKRPNRHSDIFGNNRPMCTGTRLFCYYARWNHHKSFEHPAPLTFGVPGIFQVWNQNLTMKYEPSDQNLVFVFRC